MRSEPGRGGARPLPKPEEDGSGGAREERELHRRVRGAGPGGHCVPESVERSPPVMDVKEARAEVPAAGRLDRALHPTMTFSGTNRGRKARQGDTR